MFKETKKDKKFVRRYWARDFNTERKEETAVTKPFERAIEDIADRLDISKYEARVKLLKKGMMESKFQIWILIHDEPEKNPFDVTALKTPLI